MTVNNTAAADLLFTAAAAAPTDPMTGAALAVRAAGLLPDGSAERGEALGLAAQLYDAVDPGRAWPLWEQATDSADALTRIQWLTAAGNAGRRAGAWPDADRLLRTALPLARELLGHHDIRTAHVGHALGVVGKCTGAFDEAATLYAEALSTAERAGDVDFQATISHNLGGLYHAKGEPAAAEPWARRAVSLRTGLPDTNATRHGLAADQCALAAILVALGKHREAGTLLDIAAVAFTDLYGPDHYEIGVIDGNRALILLAAGQQAAAERYVRNAIRIKTRHLGPTHPELAVTLTTLGTILRRQGRYPEASQQHRRALAIVTPAVHASHPLIAIIDNNLRRCQTTN
jgi:tetratricopeptide (TPR) repeat protein